MYSKMQLLLLGPLVTWVALSYGGSLKTHEYILSHHLQRRSPEDELQLPPRFPARAYSFDPRPDINLKDLFPNYKSAEEYEETPLTTVQSLSNEVTLKDEEPDLPESSTAEVDGLSDVDIVYAEEHDYLTGRAAQRIYTALDSIARFMPVKLSHFDNVDETVEPDDTTSDNLSKAMSSGSRLQEKNLHADDKPVSEKEVAETSSLEDLSVGNSTIEKTPNSEKNEPRGIVGVSQHSASGVSYIIHPDNLPPPTYKPLENLPPPSHPVAEWRPDIFMKVCCSDPDPKEEPANNQTSPATLEVKTGYAQVDTTSSSSLEEKVPEMQSAVEETNTEGDNDTLDKNVHEEIFEENPLPVSPENKVENENLGETPLNMTEVNLANETGAHPEVSSNHTPRYEESGSAYQDVANFLKDIATSQGFQNAFLGDLIKNFGDLDQNAMKLIYSLLIRPLEGASKSSAKSDRMGAAPDSESDKESDIPEDEDFVVLGKDRLPLRDQPANGYLPFGLFPQRNRHRPGAQQIRPSSLVRQVSPVSSDKDWRPVRTHPRLPSNGRRGDEDIDVITAPPVQSFEVVLGSSINHDESKPPPQNLPGNRWGVPPPSHPPQSPQGLPFKKLTLGLEMPPPDALGALPPGSVLIPPSQILNKPNLPHIFTQKDGTPTLELPLSELQPNLPFFGSDKPPRFRPPSKPQIHDIPPRLPSFLSSLLPQLSRPKPPQRISHGGPVMHRPFVPPGLPDMNKPMFPSRQRPTGPPPIVTKMTPPGIRHELHTAGNNISPPVRLPPRDDATDNSSEFTESENPEGMPIPGPVPLPAFRPVPQWPVQNPAITNSENQVEHNSASHNYMPHPIISSPSPPDMEVHHDAAKHPNDYNSAQDYGSENVYPHDGEEQDYNSEITYNQAEEGQDYGEGNVYVHGTDTVYAHPVDRQDHSTEDGYVNNEEGSQPESGNTYQDVPLDYILEYYDYRDYYDEQLGNSEKSPDDDFSDAGQPDANYESGSQDLVENGQEDSKSDPSYSTSPSSTIFDRSSFEDILMGNKPSIPTPTLTEQEKDGLQMLLQNHRMANAIAEANGTVFNMMPDSGNVSLGHSIISDANSPTSNTDVIDPDNDDHYMIPIPGPIGGNLNYDHQPLPFEAIPEHDTSIAHLWNNLQLIPLTPELFDEPEEPEDTMNLTALFNDAVPLSPDLAFNEIPDLGSDIDKISIDNSDGRIFSNEEMDDSDDAKFMAYILIGACCGLALLSIAGVIVIVRFKKTCGSRQIRTRTRLTEQDSIENISRRVENLTLGHDSGHKLGSWFTGRNEHLGSGKLRSNMTLPTVHDFKRGKGSKSGSTRDLLSISSEGSQLSSPRQEHRNGENAGRTEEEEPRSSWLHDEYRASLSDLSQAPGQDLAYAPRQYQQSRSSHDNAQPSTSHADHQRYRGDESMESEQIERSSRERRHTGQSRPEHERSQGHRRPHFVSSMDSEELDDRLHNRYTTDSEVEDWTTNYEDESREPSRYLSDSRELDETVARRNDPVSVTSQELGDQLSRDLKQYQSRQGKRSDYDRRDSSRNLDSSQEVDVEDTSRELHRSQSQVSFSRDNVQNEVFLEFDNIFRQHGQYLNGEAPASTLGRISRATEDTHFSASRANSPDSIDLPEPHSEDDHLHSKASPPSPPTTPPRFSPPPPPPRPPKPGHLSQPGTPSPRLNRARPPSPSQSPPSPPRNQRPVYWTSEEERLI